MSSSTSRLTPVQLHQRLIHAESEITRLTKELNRYKNDYHYNMIDELLTENEKLLEEITALKQHSHPPAKNEPVMPNSTTPQSIQQKETHSKVTETSRTTLPADESIFFSSKAKTPEHEEQDSPETDDQTTNWFSRSIKSRTKK